MFFSPFAVAIVAIIMVGLLPILRALGRRMERQGQQGDVPIDVTARLERIERAVEAVAIEVERISEGQRFTTKLLSERSADSNTALAR
jgi:hypothetical protein